MGNPVMNALFVTTGASTDQAGTDQAGMDQANSFRATPAPALQQFCSRCRATESRLALFSLKPLVLEQLALKQLVLKQPDPKTTAQPRPDATPAPGFGNVQTCA